MEIFGLYCGRVTAIKPSDQGTSVSSFPYLCHQLEIVTCIFYNNVGKENVWNMLKQMKSAKHSIANSILALLESLSTPNDFTLMSPILLYFFYHTIIEPCGKFWQIIVKQEKVLYITGLRSNIKVFPDQLHISKEITILIHVHIHVHIFKWK